MPADDARGGDFSIPKRLFRLIESLPEEEQRLLLQELETRLQHREKRGHRRKPVFQMIQYAVDGRPYSDFIQELSLSGVFIETCMSIPVGSRLVMIFRHPSHGSDVRIPGEVMRVSPQGIGVRFQPLDPVQEQVIRAHLVNL